MSGRPTTRSASGRSFARVDKRPVMASGHRSSMKHQGRENENVGDTPATLVASVPSVAKGALASSAPRLKGGIQSGPVLSQRPESERRLPKAITSLAVGLQSSPGPALGIPMT